MKAEGARPETDLVTPARQTVGLPTTATGWLAPESWGRTLLGVTRSMLVFGAVFWTGMSLMGEPVGLGQTALTALIVSSLQIFTRRSGGAMPSAPALVLGAVTLVAGVGVGVAGLLAGDREPLMFTAMGVFLGGMLLWFGFRSRRHEQELAGSVTTERVAPVLVPRAELVTRIAEYRLEQAPKVRRMLRWLFGGLATCMGILALPSILGPGSEPPEWVAAATFFGMWGVGLFALRRVNRRERADAERHGLVCASCDKSFFSGFGNIRLMKVIEEAGCCPQCGVRLITEEHA